MSHCVGKPCEAAQPQHAYAKGSHAGWTYEVRARTFADRAGSHVEVMIHTSLRLQHRQSVEYLTEDATAGGAVRSGIAIARALIADQACSNAGARPARRA